MDNDEDLMKIDDESTKPHYDYLFSEIHFDFVVHSKYKDLLKQLLIKDSGVWIPACDVLHGELYERLKELDSVVEEEFGFCPDGYMYFSWLEYPEGFDDENFCIVLAFLKLVTTVRSALVNKDAL